MRYHIRAEFQENRCEDFTVAAEDLLNAKTYAEGQLCRKHSLDPFSTEFDWRGQVVFVNQGYGVRV